MHIAVVSPLQLTTGNRTTALRIVGILKNLGHSTIIVDAFNARSFRFLAAPDFFICIHAMRSAVPLLQAHKNTPMVLVLGGTDANDVLETTSRGALEGDDSVSKTQDSKVVQLTEKGELLLSVLEKSCAVVGFSTPLCDTARAVLTSSRRRLQGGPSVYEISQGVDLHESSVSPTPFVYPDVESGTKVVLLVANLRPVKDVLFLLDAVDAAWGDGHAYTLVIVGCVIHYAYAAKVHERVQESRGAIKMYPQQTRDVLLDMIKSADMVVNSSVNEGMCAALQEAIAIGTLACARRNPGNQYLFQAVFGEDAKQLLFDTAEEFIDRVSALLPAGATTGRVPGAVLADDANEPPSTKRTRVESSQLRDRLVAKGKIHIEELTRSERTKWAELLQKIAPSSTTTAAPTPRSADQGVEDAQKTTVPRLPPRQ